MKILNFALQNQKFIFFNLNQEILMLIIDVKGSDSIDRALKAYKRRHRDVGVVKELRRRQHFVKPSVNRRTEVLGAIYRNKKKSEEV